MKQQQTSLFSSMEPVNPAQSDVIQSAVVIQTAQKAESGAKRQKSSAVKSHTRTSPLESIYKMLTSGVRDYFSKYHFKRAVLGVSGGVDSSLTLKIAVDALGPENVTGLILPELGLTKDENITHAKILCQFLKVQQYYQPINNLLTDFVITPWKPNALATMNIKARLRAVLLYSFANTERALVLGTSNKSEILLGYGTKYGDLAADIEVIGDFYKTEVIALADYIGLPPEIVHKTPSAELSLGQTDESEIGAPYKDLDQILLKADLGPEGCIAHGLPTALVQMVFRRIEENKHKTELPPVIKVR